MTASLRRFALILATLTARGYVLSRASEPLDVERLRDAVQACLVELSESPLPGARYAYEVVRRRFSAALSTTPPEAPEPPA